MRIEKAGSPVIPKKIKTPGGADTPALI